jgi:hypothetical protein
MSNIGRIKLYVMKFTDLYFNYNTNNKAFNQHELSLYQSMYPKKLYDLVFNKIKNNYIKDYPLKLFYITQQYESFTLTRAIDFHPFLRWSDEELFMIKKAINGQEQAFYSLNEDEIVWSFVIINAYKKKAFKNCFSNLMFACQNPFILENLYVNNFFNGIFELLFNYISWLVRCFVIAIDISFSGDGILEEFDEIIRKRNKILLK